MMYLAGILTFILIQTCQSGRIKREDGETCKTPDDGEGICRNLKNCTVLLQFLNESQIASPANYLKESSCGFEGFDPLVCCPEVVDRWGFDFSSWLKDRYRNTAPPRNRVTTENYYGNRPDTSTSRSAQISQISASGDATRCGKSSFDRSSYDGNRIVGGEFSDIGYWPWMAAIGYTSRTKSGIQWLCAGAIVTNKHVITAGHCIVIPRDKTLSTVRLGDLDLDASNDGASPVEMRVERAFAHPDYRSTAKVNDIGIIKLSGTISFNENIHPICLPSAVQLRSNTFVGMSPMVAGWGAVMFRGQPSNSLKQVDVKITDENTCRTSYQNQRNAVIDNRVICAGSAGKDACQGDSGAPLMLDQGNTYYIVGVVSYGKNCAEPGYPGVYTRVTSFMDWISSNLN